MVPSPSGRAATGLGSQATESHHDEDDSQAQEPDTRDEYEEGPDTVRAGEPLSSQVFSTP